MQVTIERNKCIGCGSCSALCPNDFELDETGFSRLKGSTASHSSDIDEGNVTDSACVKEAIDACPAQCIHIK